MEHFAKHLSTRPPDLVLDPPDGFTPRPPQHHRGSMPSVRVPFESYSSLPKDTSSHLHSVGPQQPTDPSQRDSARRVSLRNQDLLALKNAYSSLNSDVSCSSLSSVEELLEQRRENPEQILLALGFGGPQEEKHDPLLRIPFRFFEHQSKAKGISVGEVIKRHKHRLMLQGTLDESEANSYLEFTQLNQSSSYQINGRDEVPPPKSPRPRKHPKLLVMGTKSYRFDCDDSDFYSPKTSAIDSVPPTFPSPPRSPLRDPILSPALSQHSSENFLSVPAVAMLHRKLSCPNIDFELAHSAQTELKVDDYMRQTNKPISQSNLTASTSSAHSSQLASIFAHRESLDRVTSLNLSEILADISSNSNLNLGYFIEAALITSIQSLKLSLDFYRHFMYVRPQRMESDRTLSDLAYVSTPSLNSHPSTCSPLAESSQSLESDKERLSLQNLYLDVLEVETMLYDCLAKFKNSPNWPVFVSKYIHQLQKAVDKIAQIQESLRRLNTRYGRLYAGTASRR